MADPALGVEAIGCTHTSFYTPRLRAEKTLVTADLQGRGHGVVPDVLVAPTIDDLATGRDPVYERALAVAQELAGRP